ncbi:MAG: response regulator transcription factor [Hyphomicrobiales bacterium]|nr:response regulator transcription factor [Hyphomicrobiales bacterium]
MKRLMFVDDHPIYREGFRRAIERGAPGLEVVLAGAADEALAMLAADRNIDLCIADRMLPGDDGLTLLARVRAAYPTVAVGMLCAEPTPGLVDGVRALGGVACLCKEMDTGELVDAIVAIYEGDEVFPEPRLAPGEKPLSDRRRRILQAASRGLPDKQISDDLGISESTVRDHWTHIFRLLGVNNRTEAVARAVRRRLI